MTGSGERNATQPLTTVVFDLDEMSDFSSNPNPATGSSAGPTTSTQTQNQNIAPHGGEIPESAEDIQDHAPVTDQEVGEYREQDRFLPVCFLYTLNYFQTLRMS